MRRVSVANRRVCQRAKSRMPRHSKPGVRRVYTRLHFQVSVIAVVVAGIASVSPAIAIALNIAFAVGTSSAP